MKILVLPADSIENNISRSFFLAKYLAKENQVYIVRWKDPQSLLFKKKEISKFATLKCFVSSLFQRTRIVESNIDSLYYVYTSRLLFMVIYRFIGMINALRLSRFYNKKILTKIAKRIQPEVVFYTDGFDGQPILNGNWLNVSDVQDDFDPQNFRNNHYQIDYGKKNFSKSDLNFVVSKEAKKKLEQFYHSHFHYIPNGVELYYMKKFDENRVKQIKSDSKAHYIVSYIGGDAWVDTKFARELFKIAEDKLPNVHFLVVGNLEHIDGANFTYTGGVSKEDVVNYYHASDIGIMLKPSSNSDFLINSVPLKIIQYSILGKPFISPHISWLKEESFDNVRVLADYSPQSLVDSIEKSLKSKTAIYDKKWDSYLWDRIVGNIERRIKLKLKSK